MDESTISTVLDNVDVPLWQIALLGLGGGIVAIAADKALTGFCIATGREPPNIAGKAGAMMGALIGRTLGGTPKKP